MQITEVRIKLMDATADRLRAFCSITIDDAFVVRDLKIIDGANGPFVAMPSRKLTGHCGNCGAKNHLRANHCNQCGARQNPNRASRDDEGRARLYADIAHPINSECRDMIQAKVIAMYEKELELAKEPGYVSRYDEFDDEYDAEDAAEGLPGQATSAESSGPDKDTPQRPDAREPRADAGQGGSSAAPLGQVPAPPEKSPHEQPRSSRPTSPPAPHKKPAEEREEAKTKDATTKDGQTPWQNRPNDEFGAGIF